MPRNCIHPAVRPCGVTRRIAFLLLCGLAFAVAPTGVAPAQDAPAGRSSPAGPYAVHVAEAAQRFGVPAAWITHVLRAESAGDVHAISSAGAMGLMQIMPDTWDELRDRHGLGHDAYDVRDNILAGAAYLREMHDRYGDVVGMLAAYHAGPGRYEEYLAGVRDLPDETRAYVAALVPRLGGEPLADGDGPADWRDAPLFVAHPDHVSGTAETTYPPHTVSLFVSRAGPGDAP
ncbi:lytic transglycosylase domain-containing protein [Nitratireductor rhodophyticola]|uniref:lytic transglycosylase domain-containing protein n=1 Tax=Nitratireductor rhodophyticola TaxID=2854036 RepID=UPI003BAC2EAA